MSPVLTPPPTPPQRPRSRSPSCSTAGSDTSTAGTDRNSERGRSRLKIILLPAELSRLLAQPGTRLLPEIYDGEYRLWIFKRWDAPHIYEKEQDWNHWEVAYDEPPRGDHRGGERWVIRHGQGWWGCYTDPDPYFTDWVLQRIRRLAAGDLEPDPEPVIRSC